MYALLLQTGHSYGVTLEFRHFGKIKIRFSMFHPSNSQVQKGGLPPLFLITMRPKPVAIRKERGQAPLPDLRVSDLWRNCINFETHQRATQLAKLQGHSYERLAPLTRCAVTAFSGL